MQIGDPVAGELLQLLDAADADHLLTVITHPQGYRGAPESEKIFSLKNK